MAEQKFKINGGFFDSIDGDRLYSADEMNRPYKRLISEGIFATPQGTPSTDLQVLSADDGMNIIVKSGEGLLGGKWFESPSDIAITVPDNTDIVPRRDSVIIQIDKRESGRVPNIIYRTGTASSNPLPPDLSSDDDIIEKRVANIYVAAGAVKIGQDAINDLRGSEECLWVTSLIQQVDTSELFKQWQTAYEEYYQKIIKALQDIEDGSAYLLKSGGTIEGFLKVLKGIEGNVTGNCSGSSGSCTGNAETATELKTSRYISISGAVSGGAYFKGDANITINTSFSSSYIKTYEYTKTISGNNNGSVKWDYPSGWTRENCVIIGYQIKDSNNDNYDDYINYDYAHKGYGYAYLSNNGIHWFYRNETETTKTLKCKITVLRVS